MNEKNKRELHTELTKETIAKVASLLFLEKGINNVSLDDIAKQAGYSRTTVYAHFHNKDAINQYIIFQGMHLINEIIQKIARQEIPADQQLRYLGLELANLCQEKPFHFQSTLENISVDAKSRKENPILEKIYQVGEKNNEGIGKILSNGMAQGVFRQDIEILSTGLILWSFVSSLIMFTQNKQNYIEQRVMSKQQFLDVGFDIILRSIVKEG